MWGEQGRPDTGSFVVLADWQVNALSGSLLLLIERTQDKLAAMSTLYATQI